ncbi:MAG TPA: FHA domain-containing protein, partial [Polyangiaceae bacterium]|nr:FHA domain-containing protein [Polyangiaceae bacterium]
MLKPSITFVISRQGKVLRRETEARAVIRIGRHRSNQLQLDDEHVSKRHAVIEVAADRITLVDLAEEPSVRVNGQWIDEAALAVGDRIQIGSSEILIEDIVMQEAEAPAPAAGAAVAAPAPEYAAPPSASSVPAAALRQAYTYAFFGGGPAPRPEEVELAHVLSAEVTILWGDNVLHVAHLARGQAFWVGDEQGPGKRCDFLIPREKLGASRLPLVIGQGSGFALVIAPQALGHVASADGSLYTLDVLRESARGSDAATGGCVLPLGLGTRAELRFGDIVFRIAAVRAGKPVGHGLASGLDASAWPYFALSALSLGGLLSSMAFWAPPLSMLGGEEESDDDRLYLLQAYLDAAAERERIREPERGGAEASAGSAGESGAAAAGAQGAMGTPEAPSVPRRWASKGNADRRDRQLPREETGLDPDFG